MPGRVSIARISSCIHHLDSLLASLLSRLVPLYSNIKREQNSALLISFAQDKIKKSFVSREAEKVRLEGFLKLECLHETADFESDTLTR